ncbi:methyltransferase [Rathayibacter sp. VKM Ac-2803]|uniref:class I SAM-dependent methyltransferase n=1 Tax=unclassified Rathayibacter TaxID=2609250 RepID=UPI001359A663|nr:MULTISPECIES: methyltransferase [unclassified Rathayibacter]MWV49527.1 methyltransferase [Rathayibacter sp. VKM Ac-2803]MWV60228.1 methyltransferase [Rathayibacter sp. VKM Ac-2754]
MAAEHYFTSTPDGDLRPRRIAVRLAGRDLEVTTAGGVFSPGHIDLGTRVLLNAVPDVPAEGDLLDLGCGWGPVALTLALESPAARVWAVDVNQRALELVRRNSAELGLTNINAVLPDDVPEDVRFRTIWSNPPIRVGKDELHALLERWLPRLEDDADAWLVVQRNLGSDSLQSWMTEAFDGRLEVERVSSAKGFRILRTTRL